MTTFQRSALTLALFTSVLAGPAGADTAGEPTDSCPAGAVSVYFAPSEIVASNETVELIGRVGRAAAGCEADGVDLVAWVDPAEGQAGMLLALERLKMVSQRLLDNGVEAARLRVGARVQADPGATGPGSRHVRIMLREGASVKRADTPPALAPLRPVVPPNAV